jgi:hypothetical protein
LKLIYESGAKAYIVDDLRGVASSLGDQAQLIRAARLFAAADALERTIENHSAWPLDQLVCERHVAAIKVQLDEATFALAWAGYRQQVSALAFFRRYGSQLDILKSEG